MTKSFSIEKWPNGYVFISKYRNRLYGFLMILLNSIRWAHLLYAASHFLLLWYHNRKVVPQDRNVIWWCCVLCLVVELLNRLDVSDERLIFLKGYGLQIESRRWNGGKSVRGIPIGDVQFLLINEVMFLDDVTFYMAIILKDTEEIILPFQNAIPRLKNLKMIYRTFNEMFPDHSRYVAPETELLSMQ